LADVFEPHAVGEGQSATCLPLVLRIQRILTLPEIVYAEGWHLLEGLHAPVRKSTRLLPLESAPVLPN